MEHRAGGRARRMGSLARAGCRQCGPEAALHSILPAQHVGRALPGSPAPNLLSCFLRGEPGRPPRQQHSLKATCRRLGPQRRRAELRHKCQWEKVAIRIALCLPPLWGWRVVDPGRQLRQPQDPPLSGGGEGHPGLGKASRAVEAVPAREASAHQSVHNGDRPTSLASRERSSRVVHQDSSSHKGQKPESNVDL